jgi:hypothetical protein
MTGVRSAFLAGSLLSAFAVAAQTVPPAERESAMPQAETSVPAPAAPAPDASASPAAEAPVATPAAAAAPADAKSAAARSSQFKTVDRIELEGSAITGNRELPKVLYIVPWKKSDLGDLVGRPANSLIDEVLAPVDRDVFKRQIEYFATLNSEAATPPAAPSAAPPH